MEIFINPLLKEEIETIMDIVSEYEKIIVNDQVIQISTSSIINDLIPGAVIATVTNEKEFSKALPEKPFSSACLAIAWFRYMLETSLFVFHHNESNNSNCSCT